MSSVDVVRTLDAYGRLGLMKGVPDLGQDAKDGEIRQDSDGLRYRYNGCTGEYKRLPTSRRNGRIVQWDGSNWLFANC